MKKKQISPLSPLENAGKPPAHSLQTKKATVVPKLLLTENIKGNVDKCDASGIFGWACNTVEPETPLEVEILVDGQPVARIVADSFRQDLLTAGIGNGKSSFKLNLPRALFDHNEHVIEVREVLTGYILSGSPITFKASPDVC